MNYKRLLVPLLAVLSPHDKVKQSSAVYHLLVCCMLLLPYDDHIKPQLTRNICTHTTRAREERAPKTIYCT